MLLNIAKVSPLIVNEWFRYHNFNPKNSYESNAFKYTQINSLNEMDALMDN